jgi:hypothetical protein
MVVMRAHRAPEPATTAAKALSAPNEPLDSATVQSALEALRDASNGWSVDLRAFGERVAIRVSDRPRTAAPTVETDAHIILPAEREIVTDRPYLYLRALERYVHLIGRQGWRIGCEIPAVQLFVDGAENWQFDGAHRIACARLLEVPVIARLRSFATAAH